MNVLQQYIDIFENLDTDEIYESMISLGSQTVYEVDRTQENFVHGCQSQVWIDGKLEPTGWEFHLDSDSYMVKGIGSVVCRCLSGHTNEELENITFYDFKDLAMYFSQQRKQGMQAIINKCKLISRG
jgi:cysteine desulfuration protein SufE